MNLSKLFNFKYLKQNLKKSKGQFILFLSIVPIFTFLILMMSLKDSTAQAVDLIDLSVINILGMYVIPIIISINLFGYVYKRKSVDFINSMPINKMTIFLSNTLGGILLIILMQLINALGIVIISKMYPTIIIFSGMIFDIFLIMTISYIFVFVATNIAMSVSGNKLTQIVVTMLILFLIPFTVSSINETFYNYNLEYDFFDTNKEIGYINVIDNIDETTPYRMIRMFLTDSSELFFNLKSLLKTSFLSIVYIFIGCYIFKNRKFENTEESFQNVFAHFLVKALTIFPIIMVLFEIDYLDNGIEVILLCLAFIIAYYFIYDVVTGKKIKFIPSVINLVVTLVMLNLICFGITEIRENDFRKINKEDIAGISINLGRENDGGYSTSEIMNYYMNNEELIEYVYAIEQERAYYFMVRYREYPVKIKLKNGKEYKTYLTIKTNEETKEQRFERLIEILSKDEEYVRLYKNQYMKEGRFLLQQYCMSDEENKYFNKKVNEYIEKASLKEIFKEQDNGIYLQKYNYINHRLVKININSNFDEEVFKKVIQISNRISKENLEKRIEEDDIGNFYINEVFENTRISKDFYEKEELEIIKNVILEEFDKQDININDKFYMINSYGTQGRIIFYTKNEKIKQLYENKKEQEEIYYDKFVYDNGIPAVTTQVLENANEIDVVVNTTNSIVNQNVVNSNSVANVVQ